MKKFTKLLGIVLIMALVMSMGISSAFAASITINRDSTWDSTAESAEATYTYYKIFDAKDISGQSVNVETGAQENPDAVAVYTVDSLDKANALPNIFKVNNKTPGALTAADAASDGLFYVTLASSSTGAADIAAALKTMVDANTTLFPGTNVTSNANPVVIDSLGNGYYLIKASNGSVLAVQTLDDVTINEKNDYPKVTKEQKKAADPTYTEAEIPAEIGTYIDYQITVTIPANANKDIIVVDKMSDGLDYDEATGLTLDPNITYTDVTAPSGTVGEADYKAGDAGYDANATWQIKIPAATVIENQGKDIVITYRALVTEAALTDTGRDNEVTLTYDEGNYVLKDNTEYTTYFGGIEKVDGTDTNTKLEGVKFTLTAKVTNAEGDAAAFNVTAVTKGGEGEDKDDVLYYIPGGSSNEVVTGKDGKIIIRGLDNAKTYTLTETETNEGYNLLETPKDLALAEDTGNAYSTATFDQVQNNKGTVLPSTGGIGTTIFYVVGSILVVAAGVLLVTKKRMSREG